MQVVEVHETGDGIGHVEGKLPHSKDLVQEELTQYGRPLRVQTHEDGHFGSSLA